MRIITTSCVYFVALFGVLNTPICLFLPLQMLIEFTAAEFLVKLSDGSVIHFPNRVGAEKYAFFNFDGDLRIKSIEIK